MPLLRFMGDSPEENSEKTSRFNESHIQVLIGDALDKIPFETIDDFDQAANALAALVENPENHASIEALATPTQVDYIQAIADLLTSPEDYVAPLDNDTEYQKNLNQFRQILKGAIQDRIKEYRTLDEQRKRAIIEEQKQAREQAKADQVLLGSKTAPKPGETAHVNPATESDFRIPLFASLPRLISAITEESDQFLRNCDNELASQEAQITAMHQDLQAEPRPERQEALESLERRHQDTQNLAQQTRKLVQIRDLLTKFEISTLEAWNIKEHAQTTITLLEQKSDQIIKLQRFTTPGIIKPILALSETDLVHFLKSPCLIFNQKNAPLPTLCRAKVPLELICKFLKERPEMVFKHANAICKLISYRADPSEAADFVHACRLLAYYDSSWSTSDNDSFLRSLIDASLLAPTKIREYALRGPKQGFLYQNLRDKGVRRFIAEKRINFARPYSESKTILDILVSQKITFSLLMELSIKSMPEYTPSITKDRQIREKLQDSLALHLANVDLRLQYSETETILDAFVSRPIDFNLIGEFIIKSRPPERDCRLFSRLPLVLNIRSQMDNIQLTR